MRHPRCLTMAGKVSDSSSPVKAGQMREIWLLSVP
jgi:hypothetical protein